MQLPVIQVTVTKCSECVALHTKDHASGERHNFVVMLSYTRLQSHVASASKSDLSNAPAKARLVWRCACIHAFCCRIIVATLILASGLRHALSPYSDSAVTEALSVYRL